MRVEGPEVADTLLSGICNALGGNAGGGPEGNATSCDKGTGGNDTAAGGKDAAAGGKDTAAGGKDTVAGGKGTAAGGKGAGGCFFATTVEFFLFNFTEETSTTSAVGKCK